MRLRYSLITALALSLSIAPAHAATGFSIVLDALQEVPPNLSPGSGSGFCILDNAGTSLTYTITYSNLTANRTAAHFHGPAGPGVNAGVVFAIAGAGPTSDTITGTWPIDATNVARLNSGQLYVNIHTGNFPGGEIRGQIHADPTPTHAVSWGRIKALYR
jgi:hypothetical protein